MTSHTFTSLMRRLSKAGFKGDFVRTAVLPDWWDDSCANDPTVLPDIEVRVARFLGVPVSTVRETAKPLSPANPPRAQLRRVREIETDRLAPAIHAALQIGAAVVRSMRSDTQRVAPLPTSGLSWRNAIQRERTAIRLEDILTDVWQRGIPVVPLEVLPAPTFQGAAFVVQGRPVIVLGHKNDEPGRVAHLVAHEAGHIAAGDCTADSPVVDEADEFQDDGDIEQRAELYAKQLLLGTDEVPQISGANFKDLAMKAAHAEKTLGADASSLIFAWAARTGDYATASMAARALYRDRGARRLLRQHFARNVDLDAANESDRALLRCVLGEPEPNAAAG